MATIANLLRNSKKPQPTYKQLMSIAKPTKTTGKQTLLTRGSHHQ